ncbi:MAG: Ig-like domain-containing protein [Myxococcota bacterium]|nr:Ig-like domain-containing protein [Myxococcota bacterium]
MQRRSPLLRSLALASGLLLSSCAGSGDNDSYEAPDSPPEAGDDNYTVPTGTPTTLDVLENDFDAEDDNLDVDSVTAPENGTATVTASGNRVEYTSADDFVGVDSFDYVLVDPDGNTDTGTVTVEVYAPPTLEILSPTDGEVIEGDGSVLVTWEVIGCEVSGPQNNPEGCHLHRYVDRQGYSDDFSGTGWYGRVEFELLNLEEGPHELSIRLHKNDGSDGAWAPEVSQTIVFCMQTCEPPEDPEEGE